MSSSLLNRLPAWLLGCALLCSLVPAHSAWAGTRNVCNSSELQAAASSATPGDEIVLCAGTWNGAKFRSTASGTANQPITFRAAEPGKTILTGDVEIRLGGQYLVLDGLVFKGTYQGPEVTVIDFRVDGRSCNYCRITNVVFNDFDPSDLQREVRWVTVHGFGNRIDHSYFAGKTGNGRMVGLSREGNERNDLRVDHNLFADRPRDQPSGSSLVIGETGKYADSAAGAVVEDNLFFNLHGSIELLVNKSSGNFYRGNVFRASRGALTIRQGNQISIVGNYFFGESVANSGGIRAFGHDHVITNNMFVDLNPGKNYPMGAITLGAGQARPSSKGWIERVAAKNVTIASNTIVRTGYPIAIGVTQDNAEVMPSGIYIVNNIIDSPIGDAFKLYVPFPGDTVADGNIINKGSVGAAVSGFRQVDPGLIRDNAGVYRLSQGSAALRSAVSLARSTVNSDIDAEARSGTSDVGADVFSGVRKTPPGFCDVGPISYRYGHTSGCGALVARPEPPSSLVVQ